MMDYFCIQLMITSNHNGKVVGTDVLIPRLTSTNIFIYAVMGRFYKVFLDPQGPHTCQIT